MGFIPYTTGDGHVPPTDYLPAEAGDYTIGEALAFDVAGSHQLDTAIEPTHICIAKRSIAAAGELLPVIKISDGMVFQSELSAAGTVNIGSVYWVSADGLGVAPTGTENKNKFVVEYAAGAAVGDAVRGRFV